MRLADVLVDLAEVLSATRSVAAKHVALRARQLERYRETSSLASGFTTTPRPSEKSVRHGRAPAREGSSSSSAVHEQGSSTLVENRPDHEGANETGTRARRQDKETFRPAPWASGFTGHIHNNPAVTRPRPPASIVRKKKGLGLLDSLQEASEEAERELQKKAAEESKVPTRPVEVETPDDIVPAEKKEGGQTTTAHELRESRVPSTRLGRMWNYGGLAAGMLAGAMGESVSRALGGGGQGSVMLGAANVERLVAKLSRMRGAALKLGQMMSFQDTKMLPPALQEVLQRVQDRADHMPAWQRDRVLTDNLGPAWRDGFERFDEKPMAAASIGQVHRATLRSDGAEVAVKIQFPGVAASIDSDLDNLGLLLTAAKLLPKGLYLDKTLNNARAELAWECDYEREAQCAQRYRELLADEKDVFAVPRIYPECCGPQVLTMEFMHGVGVTRVTSLTQAQKDWIGTQMLRLCLREMTEFRFMQTDPNWTNFLYDADGQRLQLLDFGASREYPQHFMATYVRLLEAASRTDRAAVKTLSEELGYLTGHESRAMLEAHTASVLTLAEPFAQDAPDVYDFRDQTVTDRVKAQIPVMMRERLAPPPEETYSLHRKLSGAFLLCARLGSRVRCRDLFRQAMEKTIWV